jgi:putative phage-type endonuclease
MSTTIIRPSTREEWLEVRKGGIGSSEVGTIIGVNKYETRIQLWRRKTGRDEPKEENFYMKAGHYLEDAVAQFWQDETGLQVIKRSAIDWIIRDNDKPFLQVSPDRTFWLGDRRSNDAKGILECKTTRLPIDAEDIPLSWFTQVQYQLGVSGLKHASLAWLRSGSDFGFINIEFVPDFYNDTILPAVEEFWDYNINGNVRTGDAGYELQDPEAQAKLLESPRLQRELQERIEGGIMPAEMTAEDVASVYASHSEGKIIQADANSEVYKYCKALREVKDSITDLEARKEELEFKIKEIMKDAEAVYCSDAEEPYPLVTWRQAKPTSRFDAKRFKAEHPDMAEAYTSVTPGSRRFLLK